MAILSKSGRVLKGNMVYIPRHVQQNIGVAVGSEVRWRFEAGRLYLEAVENESN